MGFGVWGLGFGVQGLGSRVCAERSRPLGWGGLWREVLGLVCGEVLHWCVERTRPLWCMARFSTRLVCGGVPHASPRRPHAACGERSWSGRLLKQPPRPHFEPWRLSCAAAGLWREVLSLVWGGVRRRHPCGSRGAEAACVCLCGWGWFFFWGGGCQVEASLRQRCGEAESAAKLAEGRDRIAQDRLRQVRTPH